MPKEAARELGADEDPEHFRERLGKMLKAKPDKQGSGKNGG